MRCTILVGAAGPEERERFHRFGRWRSTRRGLRVCRAATEQVDSRLVHVSDSCTDGGAQIVGKHLVLVKHRQAFPRECSNVGIARHRG